MDTTPACPDCGTDLFGNPKKCTCRFECLTCGAVSDGKPNHPDGKCPGPVK
jgi:hypothetical protein